MRLNIKYLEYFVEVAQRKSFTNASKALFVSQPALSKAIRSLEEEVGAELIDRQAKGFVLTPEGEVFFENAVQSIRVIRDQLDYLYNNVKNDRGMIRLGIPPVITTAYFTSIIYTFRLMYPEIDLRLVEVGGNIVKNLADEGVIDIGVIILPFTYSNYNVVPVIESRNSLLVHRSNPFAGRKTLPFRELVNEKFLILDKSYVLHDRIVANCKQVGFSPDVVVESSQWDFLAEMVAQNQGVSILPDPIIQRFHSDEICTIKLVEPEFPWNIGLITKKAKKLTGASKLFIDYVIEEGAKLS